MVLLMVLVVWVALSVVAAAGFCLVPLGARSHASQSRPAVPARRRAAPDRSGALV